MLNEFQTRQFTAGNSQAVRIPAEMAYPPKTELKVHREGERIIIEPREKNLAHLPLLFAAMKPFHFGERPAFEAEERSWT